ncbi:Uncharacterized protein APZ42_021282 [Daphnia magna]|uniref:Uncharacterized protein n=1 Tax=Daphnia magna TaxID=35525 RepID=A0A164WT91_9CRUS|nr:Uncharacterized protein APZ42_021282 [Daphnia magna]
MTRVSPGVVISYFRVSPLSYGYRPYTITQVDGLSAQLVVSPPMTFNCGFLIVYSLSSVKFETAGLIQMYISPASSLLAPNSSLLVGQHKKRPRECVDVVFAQRRGVFAQSSNQDRGRSFRVLACDNRFELKKSK